MIRADLAHAMLRDAPMRAFEELIDPAPFLVLAPHPDDESLGCGGLIAAARARRQEVWVALLTDGGASHLNSPTWSRSRLVAERRLEITRALACLGVDAGHLVFLDAADAAAPISGPDFAALHDRLRTLVQRRGIGTVFAPWCADPHGDHLAAATLAEAVCRDLGVARLSYPTWAWVLPDDHDVPEAARGAVRLDIADHLPCKRRAIACHATQHGGVITDDPTGFALPAAFLAHFDRPTEVFIPEP